MSSPAAELASQYEAVAAAFVKENRLPGAAAGVVHDGELAWAGGVGFADRASRRPSDPKTLYRIASITKTFTATAIMQLRDEGKLTLDDPAVLFLPELEAAQSPLGPIESLTIRRMLSHESGLQSEPPGTNWSDVVYEDDPGRTLARATETRPASRCTRSGSTRTSPTSSSERSCRAFPARRIRNTFAPSSSARSG